MSAITELDLNTLRSRIDRIDASLLELIAARFGTVADVARLKRDRGLVRLDPEREAEIVRRAAEAARGLGLPEEGLRDVYWALLGLCREATDG